MSAPEAAAAERRVKEQAVRLLQRMQAKLDAAEGRLSAPIAIIGMACRFPLGDTPAKFWAALAAGEDGVRRAPPERWASDDADPLAYGGFLDGADQFDAEFFGISPREAAAIDPQQRIVLEVAWHALEDAGIAADSLEGSRSGVYLGCCSADYARLSDLDALSAEGYAATGAAPGVAAGRLAYALGLKGPAMVVDTACSSALVAVHLAAQALRAGECSLALAGGVNLTLLPNGAAMLERLNMMASDGRCKTFDAAADGYVRGEGCGVVVLKLLSDAQAAGDRVLAVLRGSAVNQDGKSAGLTAPNGPAQEAVIRAALANGGVTAEQVDYIEAHGTGTALGDPIEMHALKAVFGGRERQLWVGSVKSNIGHAEAAAGIAALVKAVLMLCHRAVPASLHFHQLNPHIDLEGAPIAVPTALQAVPDLAAIGVSSFGFSGTNAHAVIERAAAEPEPADQPSAAPRLLISARTPAALRELTALYRRLLREDGASFADVCFSAATGRMRLPWWVCVGSPDELARAEPSDAPPPELPPQSGRRIALPPYPFQHRRYWADESGLRPGRRLAQAAAATVFEVQLLPGAPLVADHRVRGEPLLPAADIVERLRAAAAAAGLGAGLRDIVFDRPLPVLTPRIVQIVADQGLALFVREKAGWERIAGAVAAAAEVIPTVNLAALRAACAEAIPPDAFADWLRGAGLDYGPFYDCIVELFRGPRQALARLRPAAPVALLDAAFRTAGAVAYGTGGAARLPAGIDRYDAIAAEWAGEELWAHAALVEDAANVTIADVRLLDRGGAILAAISGLRLAAAPAAESWRQWCHVVEWVETQSAAAECDAICAGLGDLAAQTAALDGAAAVYARQALESVRETEIVPRYHRLWRHLSRLAAQPATGEGLPDGPEGALLARCGEALPEVLRGRRDPLPLLSSDDAKAAIEREGSTAWAANRLLATLAAAALPPTGSCRVLEIGAGTGAATAAVLPAFAGREIEYWFTDPNPTLVAAARGRIAAQQFASFDVERPPGEQGIPESSFDLVIAANALHAARDLGAALDNAARALAVDGRLLLLEPAPRSDPPGGWIDLVLGLTEGWWRFADHELRPDYPLLARERWQELLAAHGFDSECVPVDQTRLPGQIVVLARRRVALRVQRDDGGSAAARCASLLAAINELGPEERGLVLLTRGAVGPAVADPAGAALWGIMRSLRLERPDLELRAIDCAEGECEWDRALAAERITTEPELSFVGGRRFVPRIGPAPRGTEAVLPRPDGWVLVTGAFGGLGRFAAEWLARRGARRLVLCGRRTDEADWVTALRENGATIRVEACDLADPAALDALIARLPPLAGIIHAAGVFADATLARVRPEQFAAVLAPKFDAARRLDEAFPDLDFFLLYSSAVGLFGQLGQATHVAASLALDALAIARRRRGQHAVSLGWGPWREIGAAAGRHELIRRMAAQGLGTISNEAGEALLDWALATPAAAVTVLPVDRTRFLASFAAARSPAALRSWRTSSASRPAPGPAPAPAAGSALGDIIAAEAEAVLGYPPGQAIDRRANLFELGLDSLMAVELRNRLQARLPGRSLSSTVLFAHSTIAALTAHLDGALPAAAPAIAAAMNAPVAIVGIGCRFPAGGDDPEQFWQALAEGRDGVGAPPARPGASLGNGSAQPGGYLADIAAFDPTFFGIAPREAAFMDPQHRLLLEVAWEALEDALIPPDRLAGAPAGVFIGMCNYDYAQLAATAEGSDGYAGTGGAPSIAAGRLSYLFGLTGPAMVVDTACSSSLVAVHLAVQALRSGECSLALAGGVSIALNASTTTALEQLHVLSSDGQCRPFDAAADGFVRGEGCGIVVLKLLSEAEAAGDRVLAVIRGTAVNQDGRSAGLTAPNGPAQEAVIQAALKSGGVAAERVDCIEAHGTATALGDPIEIQALKAVFGRRDRPLWVGSVKSNIGHAEAAAGIAALIKSVLMLRHRAVPASLHFRQLNPHIELDGVPIAVPTELQALPDLACIGVSSFGFSGTNAHAVIERAAPALASAPAPAAEPRLLISTRTPEALRELIARYRARLREDGADFADICASAATGRVRLPWWICVGSPEELDRAEPSDAPLPGLPPQSGRRVPLPLYPFQRQTYWAKPKAMPLSEAAGAHPLLGRRLRSPLGNWQYEAVLGPDRPGWLADHMVAGRVVVPATALLEVMLAAVRDGSAELSDVAFLRMLAPAEQPILQTNADPATRRVTVLACEPADDAAFAEIASATWQLQGGQPQGSVEADALLDEARALCGKTVDLPELYARFSAAGLDYGPEFRRLRSLAVGDGIALAELEAGDATFRFDPRVLDAAWHSLGAAVPSGGGAMVPSGLDRFVVHGGVPRWSLARLPAPDRADVTLLDADGRVVAVCSGLRLAPIAGGAAVLLEPFWQPLAPGSETPDWLDCRSETDAAAACWRVLEAYRAAEEGPSPPRLAVLTSRATSAAGRTPLPAQASLTGLVATLAQERPELRPVLLDLDAPEPPPPLPADAPGPILAWRDGTLLASRLDSKTLPRALAAPYILARPEAATLDALRWVPATRRAPGPGEVEIEIAAAGINFRDLMNLLGAYPGDAGAPGAECAGSVVTLGPGVTWLEPGDAVVAIAAGCFASHAIADARLVCRVPPRLDWRVTAGQPVALLTARLALDEVAGLAAGQRVLIHSATGGVGLAALALARMRGAEIVATAGNAAKRAYLSGLGVAEIYDSRSLDFAAAPAVDVVVNSLTGEAIPAGLRLLKAGGIFVELGKAEIWPPERVRALRPDVRYAAIELDRLIVDQPDRVGAMLRDAIDELAGGAPPLPVQPYPFAAIGDALRTMQAARHIGKLVLSRTLLRGDATYAITGGTGALGRHLARWLVERGARHLLLLSRRPAAVEIAGAEIRVLAVDVSDEAAMRQTLSGLAYPLKGVFHLAGELQDATAARLTREQLDAVLAAKLHGAEVLDRVTAGHPLDMFVLFASLAGVTGSAGQSNYAAANAALDGLAYARRARGLPALSVDWGAWQGAGLAKGRGGPPLSPVLALEALDAALAGGSAQLGVSAAAAPASVSVRGLGDRLAEAVGSAKLRVLGDAVDEIVGRILGLGDLALERERPLPELGLDSLMAIELRNALGRLIGRTLPTSLVFDHPTAAALSQFLAAELGLVDNRLPPPTPPPAPPLLAEAPEGNAEIDADDDAALLLLERKLSHAGY
ncbi:MAG TPA: SDR family NAD(P)-dependent oxidoreductase [Stellaceae bacterium]|jgi:acyl transferase domain-containing protein/NADPH:quinone reductase-like Zn-dependent oxidoreductase/SAM-dependent methyltransferase/aryl carrier-like protein